jgi:hypothetical protein
MHLLCRRCLFDALPDETLYLIAYDPFTLNSVTPYREDAPFFLHAGCVPLTGEDVPERQLERTMSLRAYVQYAMTAAAEVV